MNDLLKWDLQALHDHPDTAIIILVWGIWFTSYKIRSARQESNPRIRWEHRKRMVFGLVTTLIGFCLLSLIVHENELQQVRQEVGADSYAPSPSPTVDEYHPPDKITVETVYSEDGTELYDALALMDKSSDYKNKEISEFNKIKEGIENGPLDLSSMDAPMRENKTSALNTLDLMRFMPYAVHGYIFQKPFVKGFFERFDWYHPRTANAAEVEANFDKQERSNIKAISDYELKYWTNSP